MRCQSCDYIMLYKAWLTSRLTLKTLLTDIMKQAAVFRTSIWQGTAGSLKDPQTALGAGGSLQLQLEFPVLQPQGNEFFQQIRGGWKQILPH